jgi:hypothetical protein
MITTETELRAPFHATFTIDTRRNYTRCVDSLKQVRASFAEALDLTKFSVIAGTGTDRETKLDSKQVAAIINGSPTFIVEGPFTINMTTGSVITHGSTFESTDDVCRYLRHLRVSADFAVYEAHGTPEQRLLTNKEVAILLHGDAAKAL